MKTFFLALVLIAVGGLIGYGIATNKFNFSSQWNLQKAREEWNATVNKTLAQGGGAKNVNSSDQGANKNSPKETSSPANSSTGVNSNAPAVNSNKPVNANAPVNANTNAPAAVNAPATNSPTTNAPAVNPEQVGVFFQDSIAFKAGKEPFEKMVSRVWDPSGILEVQVLTALFKGPTPEEAKTGLAVVKSGSTGYSMRISKGVASVTLRTTCSSGGSTYTVANLIFKNLKQFPDLKAIKIFDPQGTTEHPDGIVDSIPTCLEP